MFHIITETQKVVNVLGHEGNESSKVATRKWYVFNDQNKTDYDEENENGATIKFKPKSPNQIFVIFQMHIFL